MSDTIITMGFGVITGLAGALVGWLVSFGALDRSLKLYICQRDLARKEAGKLSRIIGRQRFMIRELKKQMPALSPEQVAAKRAAAFAKAQSAQISH